LTQATEKQEVENPHSAMEYPHRAAALDWLLGRINYERTAEIPYHQRQLKLDRMRQLLTRLGQPDAGLKIVHVAGTKGKGSTSAMIAGILSAAGYRTGLFSSPHLDRIEERFAVDGQPCTASELVALIDRLRPVIHTMDTETAGEGEAAGGPTYFDVTTAMAIVHFVERQVDAAVLEVGLGGRLDSTNVCLPAVSVITSISFDHMKQLGSTLSAIAREKAGIIKPGVPVISGVTPPEAQVVIAEVAQAHGCRLIQWGRDFEVEYRGPRGQARQGEKEPGKQGDTQGKIDFEYRVTGQEHRIADVRLAMRGPHQAANAAVALATIEELRHQGWCVSAEAMRLGLSRTVLPARVELISREPIVVLDAAHNAASARALVAAIGEIDRPSRRTLVVSISHDKDVQAILRELVPHFDRFLVTQYLENPRAVPAESLAHLVRDELSPDRDSDGLQDGAFGVPGNRNNSAPDITIHATPADAWNYIDATKFPGELICITGSFFLAAEMRRLIRPTQFASCAVRPS
jgi:dihydrofolate synthase / folylpolyglutamate synthase